MKNVLLIILVIAGLFMIMGCAGQNTTTQTDQQAAQQAVQQAAQQVLQNQTLPKTFECAAGTHWSGGSGMQGTIIGVETYKGRQACHVAYSFSADAKFDYYIDMNDITSVCYVMSGSAGTPPTEVCNWQ